MSHVILGKSLSKSYAVRSVYHSNALILDDETAVANILACMLNSVGFSVTCTQNANDFFAAAKAVKPDLMIVDLFLSEGDGLDVLRELGSDCRSRIIVTSGAGPRLLETVRQAAEAHGLDVLGRLEKPYRMKEVRALAESMSPCVKFASMRPKLGSEHLFSPEELLRAMKADEFCAHFQPQISLRSKMLVGFECLVRWEHPIRGLLPPGDFLPSISAAGLMERLTEIMIEQACIFVEKWPDKALHVSVNAPVDICSKASFLAGLLNALKRHNLAPEHIIIEVTEAGDLELSQAQIDQMTRIRMHGFHLSLDDFGTGQSSLRRLVKIPFDELKIEKSFVDCSGVTEEARQVIRALVTLARAFGMSVVAEGVEDAAAVTLMRDLGCDVVQGYFIARPMSAADARNWFIRATVLHK